MRKIIITLGLIAVIGGAVKILGVKDKPTPEQTAGQWCEVFNDERDYYYNEP